MGGEKSFQEIGGVRTGRKKPKRICRKSKRWGGGTGKVGNFKKRGRFRGPGWTPCVWTCVSETEPKNVS